LGQLRVLRRAGSLQRDCVRPISHGGRYTIDNVVPACRSCNANKCNAEVTTWMRRKRLDERAFSSATPKS
jgi:5-methylcytosine-specific restriction endonuclease McrA